MKFNRIVVSMLALVALACLSTLLAAAHHNVAAQQPSPTPSATPFWTACPQNGERPEGVWLLEMRPPPFAGCVIVTTSVPELAQIRALPTGLGSVCLFPHDGWRVYLFREEGYQGEHWLVQIPDSENCVGIETWGWEAKSIQVARLGTAEPRLFMPIANPQPCPVGFFLTSDGRCMN